MPSRVDEIVDEIVRRISADGSWTVKVNEGWQDEVNVPRLAVIDVHPEEVIPDTNLYYRVEHQIDIGIQLRVEDAVADSQNSAERMLRAAAADIVRLVIAPPTELGLAGVLRLDPDGFRVAETPDVFMPRGIQPLRLTYRVNWNDPSVYEPETVG